MKIVILDAYCVNPGDLNWDDLKQFGELTVYDRTPVTDDDEIIRRISDSDIVLTNKTPISRRILSACPSVKLISVLATGYNIVDCEAARELGVTVCNTPSYSTASVAQHTFALLLEICQHTAHHSAAVYEGKWSDCDDFCFWDYPLLELSGKTIGIIGFGSIGQAVGRIAASFGMNVLVYSRSERQSGRSIAEYVPLDILLQKSDVISLHCPLFRETEKIIRKETIEKMKDGVILLNTARGGLIDERDVSNALNSGKIFAAGVDVVSTEPISRENPLLQAKNCFITPHIAWAPLESRRRIIQYAQANIRAFIDGSPIHVVN
ncbi:MAG: D-2-hydroxyacid dehydrogenase [Clostridia bacterium]|nr:D-2-hydroxyacid dehydrogenase [Clostridia bacterium]